MLDNNLNTNPFRVPDDYFELLPTTIQERRIVASRAKRAHILVRPSWAVAGLSSIALGVAGFLTLTNSTHNLPFMKGQTETENSSTSGIINSENLSNNKKNTFKVSQVNDSNRYDELMMDHLALENLSIEDILSASY